VEVGVLLDGDFAEVLAQVPQLPSVRGAHQRDRNRWVARGLHKNKRRDVATAGMRGVDQRDGRNRWVATRINGKISQLPSMRGVHQRDGSKCWVARGLH